MQYAKAMGFKVIGVDISNAQLEDVKSLGADAIINTLEEPDFEAKLKEITGGGCHAAAVFSASNAAYETAPKVLRYVNSTNSLLTPSREDRTVWTHVLLANRINGLLMVAGIPQRPLSISALDILLGKYRIAGKSSGIPKNMPEAIEFSHKHGIKAHITTFNHIQDIDKLLAMMESGKTSGRFGIVLE